MRSVFRFRLGERKWKHSELREGRINRRMLGRATQTDRIFSKTYTKTDEGIAIGLLIDESGSMAYAQEHPSGSKASKALQVSILMAEALKGLAGVELEVYSFTTKGRDTFFKYLYGGNNKQIEALGNYGAGDQNYDYQAIMTAVDQMEKHTTEKKKLLIVISDGAPCGLWYMHGRQRMNARDATKAAVEAARKKGFTVIQVAIEDYKESEQMYGKKWVLHFTDMGKLIADMRKLVTRIIRSVTNK